MPVYLDHNATTPLNSEVLEVMMPFMTDLYGNPSSVHRYGRMTRNALEQARMQVANLVGAQPAEVIFTSGGTEANNLAIRGVLANRKQSRFAISSIEHASLIAPSKFMESQGWQLDSVPVNEQGMVRPEALQTVITDNTQMLSVMAANNETGVLQDIGALLEKAKSINNDLYFHSDACQAAGKLPINFADLKLDLMSLSSHKLYGPLGAGALLVKSRVDLVPLITGGGQEKQKRSGTENLPAIVGFGAAAELAAREMQQRRTHVFELQTQLIEQLKTLQGIEIFSQQAPRLPNTVMFALQGIDGEALLMLLDKKGFAVSSGSACESGSTDASHVLLAMSVKPEIAKGAIRVSLGEQNTSDEMLQFIETLQDIKQQLTRDDR
ncbi:MAG: cysteine desulfurase [Gammaproteobacteria bacterium]|nr:cysteine desulfurase [Gammaproteobacteria bacterium]